jgi:hypothetical protein
MSGGEITKYQIEVMLQDDRDRKFAKLLANSALKKYKDILPQAEKCLKNYNSSFEMFVLAKLLLMREV